MPGSDPYWQRAAAAAGEGLQTSGLVFAAVAGFAVPWLAFEFVSSWQERRWRTEWLTRYQADRKLQAEELRAAEKPGRGRFRRVR